MFHLIASILRWFFSKTAMLLVMWVTVLGAAAIYLANEHYFQQLPARLAESEKRVVEFRNQADELEAKIESLKHSISEKAQSLDEELKTYRSQFENQRKQVAEWERMLAELQGIKGRALEVWNRLRGVEVGAEQASIQQKITDARDRQAALGSQIREKDDERNAMVSSSESQAVALEKEHSELAKRTREAEEEWARLKDQVGNWQARLDKVTFWLRGAYERVGKPLIAVSVSLLIAPILFKFILYYLWAPLISFGRPVLLRAKPGAPIRVTPTAIAQEIVLHPGQSAMIQHRFYQASDEDLEKRTKFVFSWRYPFSSLACGLFLLTRVTNRTRDYNRRLTLSSQEQAEIEMAMVEIPEGGSLICRPSFIAAVIEDGPDLTIHSHWRLFSLHSWITLQFRYFEFRGPVKLVLWAYRGVRAERLTMENVEQNNERRTNQLATIGFTPALGYRSRRSETFISYLRNQNPLFDDLFSGQGVFLCQQISRSEHARKAGKFWEQLWNGITKIIGI